MAAPFAPPPPPDPQFVLRGTQSAVNALHFPGETQAQGCPLLFSGSQSGLIHIWSLQTRRAIAALDGHGGQSVTWLQTLPQGSKLLRFSICMVMNPPPQGRMKQLYILTLGALDEDSSVTTRRSDTAAAFSGNMSTFSFGQGRDLQLCLWDLAEGRNTVVDSVHLESVGFCKSSILAEGQLRWMLAMPGKDSDEVQILEMPSKTSVCTLKLEADAKPGMPMCLRLWQADTSPRPLLLVGYEDGSVSLWDISERKVCSHITCHGEPVMSLDFDSQKARGISGSAGKTLTVWNLDEQQTLQVCHTHELINPGIADVMIRPDHKILATAGWDHRIRIFHWRTMKSLAVLAFHSASVHCVTFATDGLLAAGSKDQRISVWSLYPCT